MINTNSDNLLEGDSVWVEIDKLHDTLTFPFSMGKVKAIQKTGILVTYTSGKEELVKPDKLTPSKNKQDINVNDMSNVNSINKVDLLNNVRNRFNEQVLFTNVGKTLIIVNPYQKLANVFEDCVMDSYIDKSTAKTAKGYEKNNKLDPHIYQISLNSIYNLITHRRVQAIVISGESGAGKTETAKQAMRFITYYFRRQFNTENEESLEDKIVSCNPVLESFGNSKTLRNDNSSRFGKYIKIFIDVEKKSIVGGHLDTYLLEKSRVCRIAKGERNYHIFYQMIKFFKVLFENDFDYTKVLTNLGVIEKVEKNENLKTVIYELLTKNFILNKSGFFTPFFQTYPIDYSNFNYLINNVYEIPKVDDALLFFETLEGLIHTGFSCEEIIKIVETTCAVLLIGNIEFEKNKYDESKPCRLSEESEYFLGRVSSLLNLEAKKLKDTFLVKLLTVGKEKIVSNLKYSDCVSYRDTFAKELYNRLFSFLVRKMNMSLNTHKEIDSSNVLHIGLLDIFGFECFDLNSLEQLCINYANEKLQQLYINDIFKETERLFIREGLQDYFKKINFVDNSGILELIDSFPNGILYLLDNQCSYKVDDKVFASNVVSKFKTNPNLKRGLSGLDNFIIKHTAKDVDYNSQGFCDKNLDEFKPAMHECVESIKDNLIKSIVSQVTQEQSTNKGALKRGDTITNQNNKFLGSKFRKDMNELINELLSCHCHYIRCLKPNEEKRPNYFIPSFVMQQIKYLGILDTIRLRREGYPVRLTHYEYYKRFEDMAYWEDKPLIIDISPDDRKLVIYNRLVTKDYFPDYADDNILFGKELMFVKQDFFDLLDKLRSRLIAEKEKYVNLLVMKLRAKKYRQQFLNFKRTVIFLQKKFKIAKFIKRVALMKYASSKIVSNWKRIKFIKRFANFTKRVKVIINYFKARSIRKSFNMVFKRLKALKVAFIKFSYRRKLIRYKLTKILVLDILNCGLEAHFQILYNKSATLIQTNFRSYLFKSKNQKIFTEIKQRVYDSKVIRATLKIQSCYRMYKIILHVKVSKYIAEKIIGQFRRNKIRNYIKELRLVAKMIQRNYRQHYYLKKIVDEVNGEYNELNDLLLKENSLLNDLTLFPNNLYKKNKDNSKMEKQLHDQHFYERKLLNLQPLLYFNTSYLKLSQYDEPKLNFFAHILDFDVLINTDETYQTLWSETFKEVQKHCIEKGNPLMSIQVGTSHSALVTSNGRVFTWGCNGNGQCGFKSNLDKDFKFKVKEILKENPNKEGTTLKLVDEESMHKFTKSELTNYYNVDKPILIDNYECKELYAGEDFSLLLTTDGTLFVYGRNLNSQLGLRDVKSFYDPFKLNAILNDDTSNQKSKSKGTKTENCIKISQMSSSGKVNFILNELGEVFPLSHYTINKKLVRKPEKLKISVKFSQVECGKNFVVLLSTSGSVFTFGDNKYGQLGLGDFKNRNYPIEIAELKEKGIKTTQLSCGYKHVVIKSSLNKVYTWGCNTSGQIGIGNFRNSAVPNLLDFSTSDIRLNIIYVSAGLQSTVLLTESRHILWCGTNSTINKQSIPCDFPYRLKLPELFSFDNHQIVKVHHSWCNSLSVLYAVIADVGPLQSKFQNRQKLNYMLNSLSKEWVTKNIFPPKLQHVENYISSRHRPKGSTILKKTKY